LTEHFTGEEGCCITHCAVQPIEKIEDIGTKEELKKKRLERESFWIKELRTLTPYGLNDRLDSKNWRYRWRDDIAGTCFNKIIHNQDESYSRKVNRRRGNKLSKKTSLDNTWFLDAVYLSYTDLKNWRNLARIKVYSLNNKE